MPETGEMVGAYEVPPMQTTERGWILPEHENAKKVGERIVLGEDGRRLGEAHEFTVAVEEGQTEASLTIILPSINSKNSVVITSGWHTWSGVDNPMTGKSVGMETISERTKGGLRNKISEPGDGTDRVPDSVGTSYGFVDFRKSTTQGTEETFIGLIPGLKNLESISFQEDGDGNMRVVLKKTLQGTNKGDIRFDVFLSDENYADAVSGYAGELKKLAGDVKPYNDQAVWFSWASYGKFVKEADIRRELEVIKTDANLTADLDCIMIDDGWEAKLGQWEVNTNKFPNMLGLVQDIKEAGIKPGIWLSPFMLDASSDIYIKHPDWVIKDESGKPVEVPVDQFLPSDRPLPIMRKPYILDISIPEVREYLSDTTDTLSREGFQVLKLDYLSVVFMNKLRNKDKTPVEYYRETIQQMRSRVEEGGRKVEFIGCGAPLLESVGLFEGIRVSNDSAMQPIHAVVDKFIKSDQMYEDAIQTAFRRALPFGDSMGLMIDGIHLADSRVNIDPKLKDRYAKALPVLGRFGLSVFVGDSLVRSGVQGRIDWHTFLSRFRAGNVPQNKYGKKVVKS